MTIRWPLLFLAACGSASHPTPPANKSTAHIARIEHGLLPGVQVRNEEVRYELADRMREFHVPAVSIAVFEHGEVLWTAAFGLADVATGERATEDTQFLAGSISKSVNAYAALLAVRDGALALDTPINEALTSWKLPDNELTKKTPVTLRMLLSHTAGTTVHGFPGYAAGEPIPTVPQILDGAPPANTPAVRVDLAPGTEFRYSGGGITISQLALVEKTHTPYPELLAARVLGPFGMTRSTFDPARAAHPAVGYGANGREIEGKRHVYPEMAAAGLWTTAGDLARFFARLAHERKDPASIAAQMTTKVKDIAGSDQGIGMGVFLMNRNGTAVFGHGGADAGFQADAVASLDGEFGVVVMTSSEAGFKLMPEIERAVFAEYGWPGADPVVDRVALPDPSKFTGRFLIGRTPAEITAKDGKLYLAPLFDDAVELVPIAADKLVRRDDGGMIRADATGPVQMTRPGASDGPPIKKLEGPHYLFELAAGHFDEAVALLKQHKDDEPLVNDVGYFLATRDLEHGIAMLKMAIAAFPDSSNLYDTLGAIYTDAGDKPHAIAAYEQAIATCDSDPRYTPQLKAERRKQAEVQLAKLRK